MNRKAVENVHARIELYSLNAQCRLRARQLTASHYLFVPIMQLHFTDVQLRLIQQAVQLGWHAPSYNLAFSYMDQPQLRKAHSGSLTSCAM